MHHLKETDSTISVSESALFRHYLTQASVLFSRELVHPFNPASAEGIPTSTSWDQILMSTEDCT